MAFTALKKLSAQAAGSASGIWGAGGTTGVDLNTGVIGPLDSILGGTSTFTLSSSNVSLTFTAGGGGDVNNAIWRCTGTLLANITISPTAGDATTYLNGAYQWENVTTGNFSVTVATADGSVVLPQGRRGILFVSTVANLAPRITAIAGSGTADPVPAGSKTIWYNAAAPSGWTAVALNDYAIKIVTAGLGGVTSGSSPYSTVFGITATDSHTLSSSEIPSHTHALAAAVTSNTALTGANQVAQVSNQASGNNDYVLVGTATAATLGLSAATGGGNGHTHGLDLRVNTAAFVLAARD